MLAKGGLFIGREHPVSGLWLHLAIGGRTLALPGHVVRCLLTAGSRRALGAQTSTKCVVAALELALTLRQPTPRLVIRADLSDAPASPPAVKYTSSACRACTTQARARYTRLGNPYDNAHAEVAWSTLETELLPRGGAFARLEDAYLEVAYCRNTCFNLVRRHSALDYRSPHQVGCDFQLSLS